MTYRIPEITKWLETLDDAKKQAIVESGSKAKSVDIEIPPYLKEQKVLNAMLKKLKTWRDEITFVVRRNRAGQNREKTVQQEIKFWKSKMGGMYSVHIKFTHPCTEIICSYRTGGGSIEDGRCMRNNVSLNEE